MSPNQHSYRPEIDGLRAIAVLSVVLFHFGLPIQGGFVGVDVFFVISGFLIGGILWREQIKHGRIQIFPFYVRRFRRLAPAFFTMVFASTLIGWLIFLPFEFREFGKSVIAATVYLSNVLFFQDVGYFDTVSAEKPLLHTWSLAVEEQFYIVLPLLFLALGWARRGFIVTLVLLWTFSLVACIALTPSHPSATFYLFPFRAWELLSGVLLAVLTTNRAPSGLGASWPSWFGLALLGVSFFLISEEVHFPGYVVLLPVIGSVLVLLNGHQSNLVNRMLSGSLPVFFGKISYSLYLWHWPVFVFATYVRGEFSGPLEIAAWIGLSIGLGYLSWRFVETPVRQSTKLGTTSIVAGTVLASVVALTVGGLIFKRDGLVDRFSDRAQVHIGASADFLQDWSRCRFATTGPFEGLEVCPIGPEGAPKVLVWGDSHVRALREGLNLAAHEAGTPGLIIWRAGCAPFWGLEKEETAATPSQNAACGLANQQIQSAIGSLDQLQSVLLVGRWSYYWSGQGVGLDAHNQIRVWDADEPNLSQAQALARASETTISEMNKAGLRVSVFQQPPEVSPYDSRIAARSVALADVPLANVKTFETRITRANVAARHLKVNAHWDRLAKAGQIRWLGTWDAFCDDIHCHAVHNGTGQYFDNNHLTNSAALRIRELFEPVFSKSPSSTVVGGEE